MEKSSASETKKVDLTSINYSWIPLSKDANCNHHVIIAIVMEIADIIAVAMADKALNIHITRKGKIML